MKAYIYGGYLEGQEKAKKDKDVEFINEATNNKVESINLTKNSKSKSKTPFFFYSITTFVVRNK